MYNISLNYLNTSSFFLLHCVIKLSNMRPTGVNRKQNDLHNDDQFYSSYVDPTNGETATNREITMDEKIERLISRKHSKYDFTKSNIAVVLTKFNNKRNDMVTKLFLIDQKEKTFHSKTFDLILPCATTSNAIRKMPIHQLATVLLNLSELCELVKDLPQMRLVRDLIDPTLKIHNELKIVVMEGKEDVDETDKTLRGMKLNSEAWSLSYCSSGGLLPELEFRNCDFCKHSMVDEPYCNQSVIEENNKMINEYEEKLRVLNLYKEGKGPPLKKNNKIINRIIKPPGKSLLLQCHCFQMHCTRKDSDSGSTCFNKCMNNNGNRYPWIDGNGCTCTICQCKCNKRYKKQDTVRISAEIKRREKVSHPMFSNLITCEQVTAKNFVGKAFMMGAHVAHSTQ